MKILFMVFGEYHTASAVANLIRCFSAIAGSGHHIDQLFVGETLSIDGMNQSLSTADYKLTPLVLEYDRVIVFDRDVMPSSDEILEAISSPHDVFVCSAPTDEVDADSIKVDDKIPMFCWGFRPAVIEGREYPFFKPSAFNVTDGLLNSLDEIRYSNVRASRWI